jgi:hypothetical protein
MWAVGGRDFAPGAGKNLPTKNEFGEKNHFTRGRSVFGRLIEILSPRCRILYLCAVRRRALFALSLVLSLSEFGARSLFSFLCGEIPAARAFSLTLAASQQDARI